MENIYFENISILTLQAKRHRNGEMTRIVEKLVQLQSSLLTKQGQVECQLSSKDLLISQLQGEVGKLVEENQRLRVLAGLERKLSPADSGCEEQISQQNSSDSGCENLTSDNASHMEESMEMKSEYQLIHTSISTPHTDMSFSDSPDPKAPPKSLVLCPNISSVKPPKPPIASRESVNAKLHLVHPSKADYVLVTKNRAEATQRTGLYVLDSDDTDTATAGDISKVVTGDRATVTPVHAMTNHRAVIKPSDIKYRAKIRAVCLQENNTVTYWTDTYL